MVFTTLDHFSEKQRRFFRYPKRQNRTCHKIHIRYCGLNTWFLNKFITNDFHRGNSYTDPTLQFSKIKYTVGLGNNDLSIMINENYFIEIRHFKQWLSETRINDEFNKVGFFLFTRRCFTNLKFHINQTKIQMRVRVWLKHSNSTKIQRIML